METNSLTLYDELSGRIVQSPKFEIYYDLVKNEILYSLDLITHGRSLNLEEIKFLIESAAILACSSKDENKQLAYYIVVLVHSQYRQYYDDLASIIELILVRLGNFLLIVC